MQELFCIQYNKDTNTGYRYKDRNIRIRYAYVATIQTQGT